MRGLSLLLLLTISSCGLYDSVFGTVEETRATAESTRRTMEAVEGFVVDELLPWLGWLVTFGGLALVERNRRKWKKKANGKTT